MVHSKKTNKQKRINTNQNNTKSGCHLHIKVVKIHNSTSLYADAVTCITHLRVKG